MILEKEEQLVDELERLIKLRTLVTTEKQLAENNCDEPDDMTITDLEEWLTEIDTELASIRNEKPAIAWLFNKYLR
jgi:hypothetical protein